MIHKTLYCKLLFFCVFISVFFFAATGVAAEKKNIIVIFRYDDYSSNSPLDLEIKIIDAFKKYHLPCTFGIIPYIVEGDVHDAAQQKTKALTTAKINILKNAAKVGIIEIAQHGYSHQTIVGKGFKYSEFRGRDYQDQLKIIKRGKNYIEESLDLKVETFIPPWNSYDVYTIHALEVLGFKTLSAGILWVRDVPTSLKFLPVTCYAEDLKVVVSLARNVLDPHPVIVATFHPFDFTYSGTDNDNFSFEDFEGLLSWISTQKDITVYTIGKASTVIKDLSCHRLLQYRNYALAGYSFLLPNTFYPLGIYFQPYVLTAIWAKFWMAVLLIYGTIFAIFSIFAYLLGIKLFPKSKALSIIAKYAGPILFLWILVLAFQKWQISYKGAMAIVATLGVCLGIFGSLQKTSKTKKIAC